MTEGTNINPKPKGTSKTRKWKGTPQKIYPKICYCDAAETAKMQQKENIQKRIQSDVMGR